MLSNQMLNFDDSLCEFLKNWKYTLHPLKHINLQMANAQLIDNLRKHLLPHTFEEGRIEIFNLPLKKSYLYCGLRKLLWDSEFFGFSVAKIEFLIHPFHSNVTLTAIEVIRQLLDEIKIFAKNKNIKHIIVMIDPLDIIAINALESVGFLLKDTMFYHLFDLKKIKLDMEDRRARFATMEDLEVLASITSKAFHSRESIANRFNADPQYPSNKIVEMYKIWLEKSLSGEKADRVFVVDYKDRPVGYLTAIMPKKNQYEKIEFGDQVLTCIDPDFQRLGYFRILQKEVLHWFIQQNVLFSLIRTSINTMGVNKTSFRHHSFIACSPHTFHLDLRK